MPPARPAGRTASKPMCGRTILCAELGVVGLILVVCLSVRWFSRWGRCWVGHIRCSGIRRCRVGLRR